MTVAPCFLSPALLFSEHLSQSWCKEVSLVLHPPLPLDSGCFELWVQGWSITQESFKGLEEDAIRSPV